ncbi:hypothetical protein EPN90_03655 [Patescibacteria group bacterium]|nr:MAG: hypothetical protein EPN90_03655 [Patescibacteria group bacterium]
MQYFVGILFIALGVLLVLKTEFFYGLVGAMEWPEKHIGPGGTRIFLKIVGLVLVFAAFLLMSGTLADVGRVVLTPTVR